MNKVACKIYKANVWDAQNTAKSIEGRPMNLI